MKIERESLEDDGEKRIIKVVTCVFNHYQHMKGCTCVRLCAFMIYTFVCLHRDTVK